MPRGLTLQRALVLAVLATLVLPVVLVAGLPAGPSPVTAPRALAAPAPPFPGKEQIARALAWTKTREGDPAVAIVSSDGSVRGVNLSKQYPAYSLCKAMLLVAYLRMHPSADDGMRRVLQRMIEHSDNAAADLVFSEVGGTSGLAAFADTAGMTGFTAGGSWMDSRVTARDQASFFFRLDRWVPDDEEGFVHALLGAVTSRQRWGIPAAAEPRGWQVEFKSGWSIGNEYMTQAACLERGGERFALAILTQGNPAGTYGFGTLKGVTALLLGGHISDAYVAKVL